MWNIIANKGLGVEAVKVGRCVRFIVNTED